MNGQAPTVVYGNGFIDNLVTVATSFPTGTTIIHTDCAGHDAACEFAAATDRAGSPCNQCSAFSVGNVSDWDKWMGGFYKMIGNTFSGGALSGLPYGGWTFKVAVDMIFSP